jgi:hypothetical protein
MLYFSRYNSCIEKKNARALPHAVREEIRKRAVSRVLAGESPEVVIDSLESPIDGMDTALS